MNALVAQQLTVNLPNQLAVTLHHSFKPGEITAIVGPSGAGKTTALNLLAGLIAPHHGSLWMNGREITRQSAEARRFGYLFQGYALFPHLNVRGNVEFGLRAANVDRAMRYDRVKQMLEWMRIEHLSESPVRNLSGGERQRVALARALAPEPELLLMDEPFSALDAQLRYDLRLEIRSKLRRIGVTTIFVTHDQQEALSMGDEILVFQQGQIVQAGTPESVFGRPANRFVAAFLGHQNIFRGVRAPGGGVQLPFTWLDLPAKNDHPEVLLLPEALAIAGNGHADFDGRVKERFFLGSQSRLALDATGETIWIDLPSSVALAYPVGTVLAITIVREKVWMW